MRHASGVEVHGGVIDEQTRCVHYATERDVIAIKFACCDEFYPCHACHDETAGHAVQVWSRADRGERALLCGACGEALTIATYLEVDACPACTVSFNPGCRLHAHLYFEV